MQDTNTPTNRRLNPFAFPSETDVRFTLLVIAAVMLVYSAGLTIGFASKLIKVPDVSEIYVEARDPASVERGIVAWRQILVEAIMLVAFPFGLIFLALIIAVVIYRRYPRHIRHKTKLRKLTRQDDERLLATVQELAQRSNLSPVPSVEMAFDSRSMDGQAFGFRNHYSLGLGGRLRLLLRKNPDRFRAIILHELAHIFNNDVQRTYFAQAIWAVVIVLIFAPAISYIAVNFTRQLIELIMGSDSESESASNLITTLITFIQLGGTLVIVAAIRSSLLRVREVYADWRAVLWGAKSSLADILQNNPSESNAGLWTRLLRLHPNAQQRISMLHDPLSLFRITADVPFFVGFLLSYVLGNVIYLLSNLALIPMIVAQLETLLIASQGFDNSSYLMIFLLSLTFLIMWLIILVMVLVFGFGTYYLMVESLGLEVQRETLASMNSGWYDWRVYLGLWKPAMFVAIGFQLGRLMAPLSDIALLPELISSGLGSTFLLAFAIQTVGLVFLFLLWLIYVRFFASRTLGTHVGQTTPYSIRRLLTLVSTGLLLVLYMPITVGNLIISEITHQAAGMGILNYETYVSALPATILGALFLYAITFGITWLFLQVRRFFVQMHCPVCKQITHQPYAVGQLCEHCGHDLAPWLFVKPMA